MNHGVKKIVAYVFISVFIVSIILNILQYKELNERKLNTYKMAENCMEIHEGYFIQAFYQYYNTPPYTNTAPINNAAIPKYIKNPNNLSTLIEGIQSSEFYYSQARRYIAEYPGKTISIGINSVIALLDLYLSDIKSYRTCLERNNIKLYKGNINLTMEDLLVICNWIEERDKKKNYKVYTETEFFNALYKRLKSNLKKYIPGAPYK